MITVSGLNNGVVIDHIKDGGAMKIYEYLHLENLSCPVVILQHAKSNKMGHKDMIKIDGDLDVNFDILGVLDSNITLDFIKDEKIVKKYIPKRPEMITGVIKSKNPRCITSIEQGLEHKFKLADAKKGIYRCVYCETAYSNGETSSVSINIPHLKVTN